MRRLLKETMEALGPAELLALALFLCCLAVWAETISVMRSWHGL